MDLFEAIETRRSVRTFQPDPVSRDQLRMIVNAGRLAPTARNEQPWEFVVITDAATRRQIAEVADYGKFIAEAPVCIVVLSKATKYYLEDGSAATAHMLLAATGIGLRSCWVAGDKKLYAAQVLSLCQAPPELKLVSLIALGPGPDVTAPNKRALDDVLHWESY